jgi:hypothetical protein
MPMVLSPEEVARLLDAAPDRFYQGVALSSDGQKQFEKAQRLAE